MAFIVNRNLASAGRLEFGGGGLIDMRENSFESSGNKKAR
jgi:hypothetical protein